jgi:predicted RNA-binding Zn-ribbon protein involved in translation (DUF1610 family)
MDIVQKGKELLELANTINNSELHHRIADLQSEILELSTKNLELERVNQQLKTALDVRAKMTWNRPVYYMEDDPDPYCPNCWETKQVATHLIVQKMDEDKSYKCKNCNFGGWHSNLAS